MNHPYPIVACHLAGRCSGCEWIERPYSEQLESKLSAVRLLWEESGLPAADLDSFSIVPIAPTGLRDRVDLIYRRSGNGMALGLFDRERKDILSLDHCPQLSRELQTWFNEFQKSPPPISKGSVRLRVSPEGVRGVWLDFSNLDVKALLEEKQWLTHLLESAVVEIGQKRKRLVRKADGLGLGDPELSYWFPTFLGERITPLYSSIGTFTQVGAEANRVIVKQLIASLPQVLSGAWLELGSGIGNFTLPLLNLGVSVTALELDPIALEGMKKAAEVAGLSERIQGELLSFHHRSERLKECLEGAKGILADPPRSGLQSLPDLLEALPETSRPQYFVYVSCATESFVSDVKRLYRSGYRLKSLTGVDQFPQTSHCEYIARLERP